MTTYFMGSEFDALSATPFRTYETGNMIQAPYSRGGVAVTGNMAAYVEAKAVDPATGDRTALRKFWFHTLVNTWGSDFERSWIEFVAADGTPIVRLVSNGFGPFKTRFFFNPNNAWQAIDGNFYGLPDPVELDVRIDLDGGILELFANQTNIVRHSGLPLASLKSISSVRMFHTHDYERDTVWQQVILADYSTVGHKVRKIRPVSNAARAEWTGGASDVDDWGLNDATVLSTDSAGKVHMLNGDTVSEIGPGMTIKAVGVAARARASGEDGTPKNLKAVLGTAGGSYEAQGTMKLSSGFAPQVAIWDRNPATGQPWGSNPAAVNAPFGIKSL